MALMHTVYCQAREVEKKSTVYVCHVTDLDSYRNIRDFIKTYFHECNYTIAIVMTYT